MPVFCVHLYLPYSQDIRLKYYPCVQKIYVLKLSKSMFEIVKQCV